MENEKFLPNFIVHYLQPAWFVSISLSLGVSDLGLSLLLHEYSCMYLKTELSNPIYFSICWCSSILFRIVTQFTRLFLMKSTHKVEEKQCLPFFDC